MLGVTDTVARAGWARSHRAMTADPCRVSADTVVQGEQQTDFLFQHQHVKPVISIQGSGQQLLYEAQAGGATAAFTSLSGSTTWSDGKATAGACLCVPVKLCCQQSQWHTLLYWVSALSYPPFSRQTRLIATSPVGQTHKLTAADANCAALQMAGAHHRGSCTSCPAWA